MYKETPFIRAAHVYAQEACMRTFNEDLSLHLQFGYVFSTPTMFMMGRPVRKSGTYECITDPRCKFQHPDAWLVYLAAGDLREFFKYVPSPLEWIGWERGNKLRWYKFEEVRKKLCDKQ